MKGLKNNYNVLPFKADGQEDKESLQTIPKSSETQDFHFSKFLKMKAI